MKKLPDSKKPFSLEDANRLIGSYWYLLPRVPLGELLGKGGGAYKIGRKTRHLNFWSGAIMRCEQANNNEAPAHLFHLDDKIITFAENHDQISQIVSRDLIVVSDDTPTGLHWLLRTVNYVPKPPGQNESFQSSSGKIILLKLNKDDGTEFATFTELPCLVWNLIDQWVTSGLRQHMDAIRGLGKLRRSVRTLGDLPQQVPKKKAYTPTGLH